MLRFAYSINSTYSIYSINFVLGFQGLLLVFCSLKLMLENPENLRFGYENSILKNVLARNFEFKLNSKMGQFFNFYSIPMKCGNSAHVQYNERI